MDLVVNQNGYFLGKRKNRFYLRYLQDGKKSESEFCADGIRSILLSSRGSISIGAIELANQHYIDMAILGRAQKPIARIYPCSLSGAHLVRRLQLEAHMDGNGIKIAKKLEVAKIRHQANLLKSVAKTRKNVNFGAQIDEMERNMAQLEARGSLDANKIMGIEGRSAALYFSCLGKVIPIRNRSPDAQDEANILLNYGYGVLYHEVERACWIVGLDPYLGFLHADRPGKPSLALDLMEPFRPVVADRAVVTLFAHRKLDEKDFERGLEGEAISLSQEGRKKILGQVLGRLSTEYTFNGEKRTWSSWILESARGVARAIRGKKFEIVEWNGG
ncbi:CRISPR-associated endonuclease Cas1 [Candidatus Micrarchaeota archaeon CG10_big_fil_rev_8_21_14_0_10_45_29]|nr:MAG: CRISPR-associated endonuclease Cas1 [Candidatus Micrarchaeota archaeon CG10_big_fil_rev_8_21_14_0_10_45_29]QBM01560.1 CRISPR-associated endonuclease Cas1 [uncultured archaeon]